MIFRLRSPHHDLARRLTLEGSTDPGVAVDVDAVLRLEQQNIGQAQVMEGGSPVGGVQAPRPVHPRRVPPEKLVAAPNRPRSDRSCEPTGTAAAGAVVSPEGVSQP